jgi:hypothetical protein
MRAPVRWLLAVLLLLGSVVMSTSSAAACGQFDECEAETGFEGPAVTADLTGRDIGGLVGDDGGGDPLGSYYVYRLRQPCGLEEERGGVCNALDFQACPAEPGRVVEYLTVQQRPVVRADGSAAVEVPDGLAPGSLLEDWIDLRTECIDITALNPPPSPEEVFTYFQRLPLPRLTAEHAPPGDGLSGLPVVFWTDSPDTQTFTVDIRGFTVVIVARAEQYTWRTGDPAAPTLTSTEPGGAYPDHAVEHLYWSGTYTAGLTVTWGATFTVDGSAPADVPGTTTTDGPPVTFDVVEAAAVLTDPYD